MSPGNFRIFNAEMGILPHPRDSSYHLQYLIEHQNFKKIYCISITLRYFCDVMHFEKLHFFIFMKRLCSLII